MLKTQMPTELLDDVLYSVQIEKVDDGSKSIVAKAVRALLNPPGRELVSIADTMVLIESAPVYLINVEQFLGRSKNVDPDGFDYCWSKARLEPFLKELGQGNANVKIAAAPSATKIPNFDYPPYPEQHQPKPVVKHVTTEPWEDVKEPSINELEAKIRDGEKK